jgi:putative transposase
MYDSDVSDDEWALIEPYFQPHDKRGAEPKHAKRDIVNAVFYLNKTGCQWRMLPSDFPPWKTVYDHYSHWNRRRIWEKVLDELNSYHRNKTVNLQNRIMGLLTRKALKRLRPASSAGSMAARKPKAGSAI